MDIFINLVYLIVALCTIMYFYVRKQFSYWKDRGISHLQPKFPYGNLSGVGKNVHFLTILNEVYTKYKGNGPFAGIYLLTRPAVVVTDLDLAKNVLIKDFNYFTDRPNFHNDRDDPLSAHLFNIGGQKWKILRSKLSPTFTSGKMKYMYSTVLNVARELDKTLNEIVDKESEIELKDIFGRFTTDVIGSCGFGIECNSLKNPYTKLRIMGKKTFDDPRASGFILFFKQQFQTIAKIMRMKMNRDDVSEYFMNLVKETVAYREQNNIKRNDFMDLLIDLKNGKTENTLGTLTIEEVAAQCFIFFLAGFETSSTNMSYSLHELSLHQDIQDKVRTEIQSVLEKYNGDFSYEALMEMEYLDRIVSEALRKYPPLVGIERIANNNYKVLDTKHIIEKGTKVFVPAYAIHHDPEIYPDPEKFDPDRFSPESIKERHPTSFLGFGDGPRKCIALRFGRMQTKIGLVTMLKKYKFETCSKTQIPIKFAVRNFVLAPEGGLWLKVTKL